MINNIIDFLKKSSKNFPDKVAIVEPFTTSLALNKKNKITYSKLDEYTDKLASHIIKTIDNLNEQFPILIILPKGIDCLISFFAVAKSGNFYTLLSEDTPKERLDKIISKLEPKIIITNKNTQLNYNIHTVFIEDIDNFSTDCDLLKQKYNEHIDNNLLYVLFTSGSTGEPKGVCISHKGVIDYALAICETFKFNSDFILANQTPFYFDASIKDIFPTIAVGATLHIIPNSAYAFPIKIIKYLEEMKINTIIWVPTVLTYFSNFKDFDKLELNELKRVYWSGEIMPTKTFNKWRKQFPNIEYANLYGPTEITDTCSYYIFEREILDNEIIPIGGGIKIHNYWYLMKICN